MHLLGVLFALTLAHADECAELFARTRAFVEDSARVRSQAAWTAYLAERGHGLAEAYAGRGLRRAFVARQLAGLVFARGPMNLRLFDLASPEFRAFARADSRPSSRHLDRQVGEVGGLTYVTVRDGVPTTVIAVDPAAPDLEFADVMMEEALHVRLRQHWAQLDFVPGHRPYVFTAAGAGFMHLLDEFVAKELLYVHGRGQPRDREELLGELLADVRRRPRTGARGFDAVVSTLVACADEYDTSWRTVALPRVLGCAYRLDAAAMRRLGTTNAFAGRIAAIADLAGAAYARRIQRVKKRLPHAGID